MTWTIKIFKINSISVDDKPLTSSWPKELKLQEIEKSDESEESDEDDEYDEDDDEYFDYEEDEDEDYYEDEDDYDEEEYDEDFNENEVMITKWLPSDTYVVSILTPSFPVLTYLRNWEIFRLPCISRRRRRLVDTSGPRQPPRPQQQQQQLQLQPPQQLPSRPQPIPISPTMTLARSMGLTSKLNGDSKSITVPRFPR